MTSLPRALTAGLCAVALATVIATPSPSPSAKPTVTAATAQRAGPRPKIRHGYVDARFGQLHYAISVPDLPRSQQQRPLILLHQTPNSSAEFGPLISEMARNRVTIALDSPGYGGSDAPLSQPRIEDYAEAIADALRALGYSANNPVDVFGNHTGAFVATALANQHPAMVRRLALAGVFVVPDAELQQYVTRLKHPASSAEVFQIFCTHMPRAEKNYTQQKVPDDEWGTMRAESLLSGRLLRSREYGHTAAFDYAARVNVELPRVRQPTLLMALDDKIGEATIRSASLFRNAKLLDLPNITAGDGVDGLFMTHTNEVAQVLRDFFDRPWVAQRPKA